MKKYKIAFIGTGGRSVSYALFIQTILKLK